MGSSGVPTKRTSTVAVALLAVFFVGMNPPVIDVFNRATTVGGLGLLYAWLVVMAIFASASLAWAAYNDAFALTERQVPPELREREGVVTATDERQAEEPAAGGE